MGTHDSELMGFAHEAIRLSREHVAQGGIPFSGVVVGGGRILGTGFNRVREDNDLDRYRLVMDVIDRVPGLGVRAVAVRQEMGDIRGRHHDWIREHGTDLPEVADWKWGG